MLLPLIILLNYQVLAFENATVAPSNPLWTFLLENCQKPSLKCIETNLNDYFTHKFQYPDNFQLNFIRFQQINTTNTTNPTNLTFQEKTINFLKTHIWEIQLPETLFEGAVLKLSPKSFQDYNALVKLEIVPKQMVDAVGEARLFKKLRKFITERLLYALLAILLIIKLLAAKFMFLTPAILGAVAAKKLLLKIILFLFPILKHLFKLCPYAPHGTKLHHHKHQIAHIHHIGHHPHHPPHHFEHNPHEYYGGHEEEHVIPGDPHHGHLEVIAPHSHGPPNLEWLGQSSLHHFSDVERPHKPFYRPHEQELEFYSGGPQLSHHFLTHRDDPAHDNNELQPWGQGLNKPNRPLTPAEIENMIFKTEKEALIKTQLHREKLRIQQENLRLQEQLKQAIKLQEKLKQATKGAKIGKVPSPFLQTPAADPKILLAEQLKTQQKMAQQPATPAAQQTTQQPVTQSVYEQALYQAASITFDPFYSPILEKIDGILVGLGFNDEPCRERLICSMYKNPPKYSPHSNYVSAELSRDPNELEKPKTTNAAVVRFYRYVQAARHGQDKKDCLRLYANCAILTE